MKFKTFGIITAIYYVILLATCITLKCTLLNYEVWPDKYQSVVFVLLFLPIMIFTCPLLKGFFYHE